MITVTLVNLPGSYLSALYGISDILGYANDLSGSIFDVSIRDPDNFVRHPPASGLAVIPPFRVDRDGIRPDPAVVKASLERYADVYQKTVDGRRPIWAKRHEVA